MSTSGNDDTPVSALPLLGLPYTFTQVTLLTSSQFQKQAKDWGHLLTVDDLSSLEKQRLLVPFFRLRDTPGCGLETADRDGTDEAELARAGRLVDPWALGDAQVDGEPRYSQWQLLALRTALPAQRTIKQGFPVDETAARLVAARERSTHIALAALTNRFFSTIIGKLTAPRGSDLADLRRSARDVDAAARLAAVSTQPDALQCYAEWLLTVAHADDPLGGWWRVVRHSNHRGWFQLKGAALQVVWQRIGAEVLLRAHEELAEAGAIPHLPEPTGGLWMPLMDRIGGTGPTALSLEHALTQLAVSPHPLVVVVVEGATEELHFTALLDELGWSGRVRVVNQQTSGDHPHEIARFLAPQVREVLPDRQVLERNPTTMFVVMDPEDRWAQPRLNKTVATLREHLREEVQRQGGGISDNELDELLKVRTWPKLTYEFANFTDGELVDSLLAVAPKGAGQNDNQRGEIADHVKYARERGSDFKVVLDRLHWPNLKVAVAKELIPVLVSKLDLDPAPPVLAIVREIATAAVRLASGTIYLAASGTDRAEPTADQPAGPA